MTATRTIRGEQYTITGKIDNGDGRFTFELVKASDGTAWQTIGKNITPQAKLESVAAPATPVVQAGDDKRRSKIVVSHTPAGTFMTGTPFQLRFVVAPIMRANGWEWNKPFAAWELIGSAGKPANEDKIIETCAALADRDIEVTEYIENAPAPVAKPQPVKVTKPAPSAILAKIKAPVTRAPAAPVAKIADPGSAIAKAMRDMGYASAVIDAAVRAARAAVGYVPPAAPVAAPAAPVAAPASPVTIKTAPAVVNDAAGRRIELPRGTRVKATARELKELLAGKGFRVAVEQTDSGRKVRVFAPENGSADWAYVDACVPVAIAAANQGQLVA